jgi:mycofactocin precursor peptide peptidase
VSQPARRDRTALAAATSPEVSALGASRVLVVPLGATEQHGPHLPLSTDTDIAVALCEGLARRSADVVVAPAVPYGASGEHAGFAGTLSIGSEALALLLLELVRSATETFHRVLLVSAHGGNADAVTSAVQRLVAESREVRVFSPQWAGDLHAGHWETSLMMAIAPERVRTTQLAAGNTGALAELWPTLRSRGVRAVSESGVLGDPTTASAAAGNKLLAQLVDQLAQQVADWSAVPVGATP